MGVGIEKLDQCIMGISKWQKWYFKSLGDGLFTKMVWGEWLSSGEERLDS